MLLPDHRLPVPAGYESGSYQNFYFGSAHTTVCNFVFCDGSVHAISYSIEPRIHGRLGNRCDGEAIDEADLAD